MTVSTHAPRAGGDQVRALAGPVQAGFNPRPPRGGRPGRPCMTGSPCVFQPTPPARGATRGAANEEGY